MRPHNGMWPQDVLILAKLVTMPANENWRYLDIAQALGLSAAEVSDALDRCRIAGLVSADKRKVFSSHLLEFLLHGLRYVFPVEPGAIVRGVPTAHSAAPLSHSIKSDLEVPDETYVWPTDRGQIRGQAIEPLYPSVPLKVVGDEALYEFLALLDALRAGRARERVLAAEEIKKRVAQYRR